MIGVKCHKASIFTLSVKYCESTKKKDKLMVCFLHMKGKIIAKKYNVLHRAK